MDFTFGIITGGNSEDNISKIVESIRKENIPNYEIIIVGQCNISGADIVNVPFDETIKPMWITKKKNIITELSKYENIVYLHDYIYLEANWYVGQLIAGNDFYARMDIIKNLDGTRFRDWCIFPDNNNQMDRIIKRDCMISYDITHLSKYMYFSGSYWIAKKYIMQEIPLKEDLGWNEGEDLWWSFMFREKYNFSMNINSSVKLLKYKDPIFNIANEELNTRLRQYNG